LKDITNVQASVLHRDALEYYLQCTTPDWIFVFGIFEKWLELDSRIIWLSCGRVV
jgi:hypothetical protein